MEIIRPAIEFIDILRELFIAGLEFITVHQQLFSFFGVLVIILLYVHIKYKRAKYKYTDSFFHIVNNKDHEFYPPIRIRDIERIKNLPKRNKKNIIGRDIDDTTSFAITLAAREFKNHIIGIDCRSLNDSPFEIVINEIMSLFKSSHFMDVIANALMYRILGDKNIKDKNTMGTIEQIGTVCKKKNYVVILFNYDKDTVHKKNPDNRLLNYFMETVPNLIITSNATVVTSEKAMEIFRLTGLDYFSFCAIINYKIFQNEDKTKKEFHYIDEQIKNISSQKYNYALSLSETNKDFYADTFSLTGNESGKFGIIKTHLDINERDKSIPLTERKFLKEKIMGDFDTMMTKLDGKKKALLSLMYNINSDYGISLYDKDLDRMFNEMGINYFPIRDYLLNLGMIEEMRPENYCNFLWESELIFRKDRKMYCKYFTKNSVDDDLYMITYYLLPFNIEKLFELGCHQRSFTHTGVYLSPLFLLYLNQRKYVFTGTEDLSRPFLEALESTISGDKAKDKRKKMVLHRFRTILIDTAQSEKDSFATDYMKGLGNIYDEYDPFNYFSYLLNKRYKFKASYSSIISNEAVVFFRGNLFHERRMNTKGRSILK
jgi:hypothetical protein